MNPKLSTPTAKIFARNDLILELPAFLGVLLTGGYLTNHSPATGLLTLKVAAGVMAIGVTIYGLALAPDPQIVGVAAGVSAPKPSLRGVGSVSLAGVAIALAISLHLFLEA